VQVVFLSLPVMPSAVTSGRSRLDGWTASEGGILGKNVALVSLSESLPHLRVIFSAAKLCCIET
jgi:hypothetical protein